MVSDQFEQTVRITSVDLTGEDDGARAQLVVLRGTERGRVIELHGPTTSIGRRLDNNVVLYSTSVSKYHAALDANGSHHHVRDLGSTNGTLVNQVKLETSANRLLCHGDTIALGDHLLLYCRCGEVDSLDDLLDVRFDAAEVRREVDALLKDFPERS